MKTHEIAKFVGGKLNGDSDIEITSIAGIGDAKSGQLSFFEKSSNLPSTKASCVIVSDKFADSIAETEHAGNICLIIVANPKLAFAKVVAAIHPEKPLVGEIHPSSVISESARLGPGASVDALAYVGNNTNIGAGTHLHVGSKVGDNAIIGNDCVLHPNVLIEDNCIIGNGVILHAGAVVGADGFGYVKDDTGDYHKFPQIGTVVIEDNVEIGANTCVDRGSLGITRVGEGTKIDNLVQVGHNVDIGKRCVIAAQTGISGSVVIEDDCVIGGQVGFGDHARVQSGAVIGSQAGVLPGKIVRPGIWWGTPIQPLNEFKRQNAHVKGIERLKAEVKELKEKLSRISNGS